MFGGVDFIRDANRARARMAIRQARRNRRRRYNYPTLGTESKYYETSKATTALVSGTDFSAAELNPTAGVSLISTPAVGDGETNRDGKKIIITQVEVKGMFLINTLNAQSALPAPYYAWIALVLDTQTNLVEMNSEDCFKALTNVATEIQPWKNLTLGGRFRILKMKKVIVTNYATGNDSASTYDVGGFRRHFKFFKKMRLPVNFKTGGTTSDVANVTDNSLHIIGWCSAVSAVNIAYQARIRFIG